MPKTLNHIKCRCGHDQAQHKPLDTHNLTWCRGDCGCSYFEQLHEPEPTQPAPQLRRPWVETWAAAILAASRRPTTTFTEYIRR